MGLLKEAITCLYNLERENIQNSRLDEEPHGILGNLMNLLVSFIPRARLFSKNIMQFIRLFLIFAS